MQYFIVLSGILQVAMVFSFTTGQPLVNSGHQSYDTAEVTQVLADLLQVITKFKCNSHSSGIDSSLDATKFLELQSGAEEFKQLKSDVESLKVNSKTQAVPSKSQGVGTTYVRWGRTTCPANGTELVYNGVMTGGYYNQKGAGTNFLCATRKPEWLKTTPGTQNTGNFLYGAEYYASGISEALFDHSNAASTYQHDAPCAVCLTTTRGYQVMIPGKITCEPGWTREYYGYLMTAHYTYTAKEYICVDYSPEIDTGGSAVKYGALLFFVEAKCGSLPCPAYVEGNEVTCVVCTK